MRFISTAMHGIMDYLVGILLIVSPWLFGFAVGGAAMWIPIILGVGVILYSIFTNYEYSLSRNLSMPTHLTMDGLGGIFLAASPWLFGFAHIVFLPHVIIGGLELITALCTETEPSYSHKHHYEHQHHRH